MDCKSGRSVNNHKRKVIFKENGRQDFSHKKAKLCNVSFDDISTQRKALPIFKVRNTLLKKIRQADSIVVLGETACGKTTQIPQYIYEVGENKNKLIGCTQPRRVAAITVAQRVSKEANVNLGDLVGYSVRFDNNTSPETQIQYMTDGMLLREAISDSLLKRYSVVILDEAHERSIHTDVLFGIVKKAQKQRKRSAMLPLKVIIMSATMDVDHFSKYFDNAPVVYIEGRQFPVKLYYAPESQTDYLHSSLVTVFQIHQEEPPDGDILLFLTGQEEIEATVKAIKEISKSLPSDCTKILACPMYANMPPGQQLKIFRPTPEGCRKVIVATNIAETSVTINGIKYVVDSGMVKAKMFNPKNGLDLLKVQKISQNQAWQRTGRAGRNNAGFCYRLYMENEFETRPINTIPEIQRCNLGSVVLQLMALGISDVSNFDFMDKPSPEHLDSAYEELILLGAVSEDKTSLTSLGRQMADFPLEPKLAKVIISAKEHQCLEEVLTIVSLLSTENLLHNSPDKREEANRVRKKFMSSEGDHLTLLNIFRSYKGVHGNKDWCYENFINHKSMMNAMDIRRQLADIVRRIGMPILSCERNTDRIRKCFLSGYFMNCAELRRDGEFITSASKQSVSIHPSSSLFLCNPSHVVYNELIKTTKCYMKDVMVFDPEWLEDIAPKFRRNKLKIAK